MISMSAYLSNLDQGRDIGSYRYSPGFSHEKLRIKSISYLGHVHMSLLSGPSHLVGQISY